MTYLNKRDIEILTSVDALLSALDIPQDQKETVNRFSDWVAECLEETKRKTAISAQRMADYRKTEEGKRRNREAALESYYRKKAKAEK